MRALSTRMWTLLFLCAVTGIAGCYIGIGGCGQVKKEKTEELYVSMAGLSALDARTAFGSIKISGDDVTECRVKARIFAQAPTGQEAQRLLEKAKIKAESVGGTLNIEVEKPRLANNRCIGAAFDIICPRQTRVESSTSFGSIKVRDIQSDIHARTSFSSIKTENTQGAVDLETSYGTVTCRNVTSTHIKAKSSFGGIAIFCSPAAPPQIDAEVHTSYGGIEFKAPPGFSGAVDLETSFGSIETKLPVTVKGRICKDRIKGVVGPGDGSLRLTTSFGSIGLK